MPCVHPMGDIFLNKFPKSKKIFWFKHFFLGNGFSQRLPNLYGGGSVIYEGFQILKYLGFKEIYLLGVDMNYKIHQSAKSIKAKSNNIESLKDDDPNHFDTRYFGKGKKYHQPESYVIDNIRGKLKYLSSISKQLNISIINVGLDSKVDYFEKRDFLEIIKLSSRQQAELFEECLSLKTKFRSIEEFKRKSKESSSQNLEDLELGTSFYMNVKHGFPLVRTLILTHLVLGPFMDELYFINRSKDTNAQNLI